MRAERGGMLDKPVNNSVNHPFLRSDCLGGHRTL